MDIFSLLAPFYDRAMGRRNTAEVVSQIRTMVKPLAGGRVLDVGGGTGRIAEGLAQTAREVVLLDMSRGMMEQARRKRCCALVLGSANAMPFPDCSFDAAVCVDAFHHMPEPEKVVAEVARVLRPGGQLFIQDYDIGRWPMWLVRAGERLMGNKGSYFRPDSLKCFVEHAGLTAEAERREWLAYSIVWEKRAA